MDGIKNSNVRECIPFYALKHRLNCQTLTYNVIKENTFFLGKQIQ